MAQPDTCILVNRTKQLRVYNLPHAVVPEAATMRVVATREHNIKTGERIFRPHKRPVSGSVTLLPSASSEPVPRSVLRAPDIQEAIRRGELAVEEAPAEGRELSAELPEGVDTGAYAESVGVVAVSPEEMAQRHEAELAKQTAPLQSRRVASQDAQDVTAPLAGARAARSAGQARHAGAAEAQKQAIPGTGVAATPATREKE